MSATRIGRLALAAVTASLLLFGCGSTDDGPEPAADGLGCNPTSVERRTDVPTVEPATEPVAEVETEDLDEGTGCPIGRLRYAVLDLVGATASDGNVFVSTFDGGPPLTIVPASGLLLPALENSIIDMQVGGRRQVTIPAEQAYGADGNPGQGIGPDEDIVFVVDLVAVSGAPKTCSVALGIAEGQREGKPTEVDMPLEPVTELGVTVLEEGDGPEITESSYVRADYLGVGCIDGQQFDSSWDREEPIAIAMPEAPPADTATTVIDGWNQGLLGIAEGSLVQLDIPAELAYNDGALTFIIRVVEVSDEPPPAPEPAEGEGELPLPEGEDGTDAETGDGAPDGDAGSEP